MAVGMAVRCYPSFVTFLGIIVPSFWLGLWMVYWGLDTRGTSGFSFRDISSNIVIWVGAALIAAAIFSAMAFAITCVLTITGEIP